MPRDNPPSSAEFVGLLTLHQADLWAFIITLMPGDSEVADVLQKTNLVLWNEQKKFKKGTNFLAWSFTIARFEVLTHWKNRKRQGQVLPPSPPSPPLPSSPPAASPPLPAASPPAPATP